MQQLALIAAVRGPDGLRRDHVANLLTWLRRCFLIALCDAVLDRHHLRGGGALMGASMKRAMPVTPEDSAEAASNEPWQAAMNDVLSECLADRLPRHFQLHFTDAAEVLGYKHPERAVRDWWHQAYLRLASEFRLCPETEAEFDRRLGDEVLCGKLGKATARKRSSRPSARSAFDTRGDTERFMRSRGRQRGTLRQEGKWWVGYWNEWVVDPGGAKARWKKFRSRICPLKHPDGSHTTKKEAQEQFESMILDKLTVYNRNPRMLATLNEFVKLKFMPRVELKNKRKGQEHYRNVLKNHILPHLGELQLRQITLDQIQQFIREMAAKINPRTNEPYSPQMLLHIKTTLNAMFNYAKRIGWFHGELPTFGVELPEIVHRERVALTKAQFNQLLDALASPVREMVLVLALTGLRIGELLGLRWGRVNLTDEPVMVGAKVLPPFTAIIVEAYIRVGREQVVDPATGKKKPLDPSEEYGQYQTVKGRNHGGRIIPLLEPVVEALRQVRQARKEYLGPEDAVFAASTGKPKDGGDVMRWIIKPALKKLMLPNISWHDLRHTANAWAEGAGMTLTERKKMFGWKRNEMAEVYGHADVEEMREGMKKAAEGVEVGTGKREKVTSRVPS